MRLLDEQQLGVPCNPGSEGGRYRAQTARDGVIESPDPDAVRAADSRAEGGEGGTQHIHPRITLCHHRFGGHRVDNRATGIGCTGHFGDPGPQHPRRRLPRRRRRGWYAAYSPTDHVVPSSVRRSPRG
ncbi:Uncharacterised protein [Mycobacteroides abscessus subsp. massiliense]|nr:Uncharacterised protein [Mycobacteroides abscessus subsp. massiliense]